MAKKFDTTIRGGLLVSGTGIHKADLGIQGEKIAARTVQSHDMIRKTSFGRSTQFSLRDETHIILIARVRNLEHLKDIFGFAESREVPVVYETDDHLLYDRRSDAPHEHAREVSAYLKRSACIIASTPYLADELRSFNERVSVFPNLLDPEIWNIRRPVCAGGGNP